MSQLLCACFSQKSHWLFVSSVVNSPCARGAPGLRSDLSVNLRIHAQIRTAFCNWNLCSTSSISFFSFTATLSTFCTSLASVWLSSDCSFITSAGQNSGHPSHLGACHHRSAPLRALHNLQDQRDYLLWEHSAFVTVFSTNCLYSPCPQIQYKATELFSRSGYRKLVQCVSHIVNEVHSHMASDQFQPRIGQSLFGQSTSGCNWALASSGCFSNDCINTGCDSFCARISKRM